MNKIIVFMDGGCRGNGTLTPDAYGSFKVYNDNEMIAHVHRNFPEVKTSNQAEYETLVHVLRWIRDNLKVTTGEKIKIFTDSQLVIMQVTGQWKVKNSVLAAYVLDVIHLRKTLRLAAVRIFLEKVPRDRIVEELGH